jgi:hypothetical protein
MRWSAMNDIPGGDRPTALQAVQDWQRRAGCLRRVHLRLSPRLRSVAVIWGSVAAGHAGRRRNNNEANSRVSFC